MKMIVSGLAASVLLAGLATPAGAQSSATSAHTREATVIENSINAPSTSAVEVKKAPAPKKKYVQQPQRYAPRQAEERSSDGPATGSTDWWRKMDLDRRGGHR